MCMGFWELDCTMFETCIRRITTISRFERIRNICFSSVISHRGFEQFYLSNWILELSAVFTTVFTSTTVKECIFPSSHVQRLYEKPVVKERRHQWLRRYWMALSNVRVAYFMFLHLEIRNNNTVNFERRAPDHATRGTYLFQGGTDIR